MAPTTPIPSRPYDSRQIANVFIRLARSKQGKGPSITQVIKLAYMAHGWTLALHDHALVNDRVEAWKYGPVIPTVYYAFRPFGTSDLQPIEIYEDTLSDEKESLVRRTYEVYGHLSPIQWRNLTHAKNGPWEKTYRHGHTMQIPDSLIKDHFRSKQRRARAARA